MSAPPQVQAQSFARAIRTDMSYFLVSDDVAGLMYGNVFTALFQKRQTKV